MGTTYTEYFDVIADKKTKFPRFFVHHDIHSILTVSAMKYSDHNIMSILYSLRTWVTFNKFSTHRVASIDFLKYVSTGLALHSTAKKRATNALLNVDLNKSDISALHVRIPDTTYLTTNNKRNPDGNRKEPDTQDNTIVFPAFDLSTERVGFGNGTTRVTTIAYEIRCHSVHATLLKSILIQASALDLVLPSGNHIHFIPYGILQTTNVTTVKHQITQQNCFLAQTGIVPILNITQDTMNSRLKEHLLAIPPVIGLKPTYFITKSGKWLVIVKNSEKIKQEPILIKSLMISSSLTPKSNNLAAPTTTILIQSSFLTLKHSKKKSPLRSSNSTIHHNMQLNATSAPHTMSTISYLFRHRKKRKDITKKNKQYTFDHHQYYRFHI